MSNNLEIPLDIQLTDDVIGKFAARRRLAEAWFPLLIQPGPARKVSEKGHLMIVMQLAPLKDPDDTSTQTSPMVRHNLCLPFLNKNFEGHVAPNTSGLCHGFVKAILGDACPLFPAKDAKKGGRWYYNGQEIKEEECEDHRREVAALVANQLLVWWKDPELLAGHRVFGLIKHDGDFASIDRMAAEMKPGLALCPVGEYVSG